MKKDLEIIYEDDDLIAVNKPAGMFSVPDRMQSEVSLKDILQERYGKIFVVHRLDKETSGVIVFAKNEDSHKFLSQQFENRETKKIYTGLVLGKLANEEAVIDKPVIEHPVKKGTMITATKGKESITSYRVMEVFKFFSLLEFQLHTGRTHQIRVHMKYIGHPLVCDPVYGDGKPVLLSSIKKNFKLSRLEEEEKPILSRLALHAALLTVENINHETITLEADLPKDLRALLQQLRKQTVK
jgi:23S rRNA pseudouridine1911/1915/1917 synthase